MTQAQVGKALGVSPAAISYLETGARRVSSVQLVRLARLFGKEPEEFLAESFQPGTALEALFRTQLGEEALPELLEAGRRCLELGREEAWLEDLLGVPRKGNRPEGRRPRPAPTRVIQALDEGEEAAATERERLGLGRHPLPDLVELLEEQGIRATLFPLPKGVDGLILAPPGRSAFVVVHREHDPARRRFSFAHEYAHVLLDAPSDGIVSWSGNRKDLKEIRANAFAAAFLMPAAGVRDQVASLGRLPRQGHAEVFDGDGATRYRLRPEKDATRMQPTDLVHLAGHFGVGPKAVVFRLKNLGLITEGERDTLLGLEEAGRITELRHLLGMEEPPPGGDEPPAFPRRFLALVTEALRRQEITGARARELAALAGMDAQRFEKLCDWLGLAPEPTEAILPDLSE